MVASFDFEEMKNKIKNPPRSFFYLLKKWHESQLYRFVWAEWDITVTVLRCICASMVYDSLI